MNELIAPEDCTFCDIVSGKAPAHRVFENERALVFMDIFPVAEGHTLLIPKTHCTNLLDADAADLEAVISISQTVAHAIQQAISPDGIRVFQLNGAAVGQTVFHYHMHLIPHTRGNTLQIRSRTPGDPDRLAETARSLAAAVAAGPVSSDRAE